MVDDPIERLVRQLLAAAPDLRTEGGVLKAREIAVRIRADIGGERHYIKKAPGEEKALGVHVAQRRGVPVRQAFREVRVSRSHGYALLARRPMK